MEENSINIADYNYIDEKLFITKSEDQMSIILALSTSQPSDDHLHNIQMNASYHSNSVIISHHEQEG